MGKKEQRDLSCSPNIIIPKIISKTVARTIKWIYQKYKNNVTIQKSVMFL
jgi:hypothetical protein